MRIVYVTASLPYGPSEAFILPEITELQRLGHEIMIVPVLPRGPLLHQRCVELESAAVTRGLLSCDIAAAAFSQLVHVRSGAWTALRGILATHRPVIALKNLAVFPKGLWLGRLANEWRAQHIHAHWASTPSTMAMVASAVAGIPWSLTAHRQDIRQNNLLKRKTRDASFARFISYSCLEMAKRAGVPDQPGTFVLHMGVELPEQSVDSPPEQSDSDNGTLICVGRLIPVKGHRYLLEALTALRLQGLRPRLWLVGEGQLRSSLERQVHDADLGSQVEFFGNIPHQEVLSLYRERQVTAAVLPSITLGPGQHEGIPVSLMEAMAYGVPVIGTATGGIPELLKGEAGLLVPQRSSEHLARALRRVLDDARFALELGEAGRLRVQADYAAPSIARELASHLTTHLRSQPPESLTGSSGDAGSTGSRLQ